MRRSACSVQSSRQTLPTMCGAVRRVPRDRRRGRGLDDGDLRGPAPRHRKLALVRCALLHPHGQTPAGHADRAAVGVQARPHNWGSSGARRMPEPNQIIVKLDPSTGIRVMLHARRADVASVGTIDLDVEFAEAGGEGPTPYEVLLHAAMMGDSTRFARQDGVEETWRIMQPLARCAEPQSTRTAPGSWGPEGRRGADRRSWRMAGTVGRTLTAAQAMSGPGVSEAADPVAQPVPAGSTVRPQLPRQDSPGANSIRSRPDRRASGGQVIGSTATALRRRSGCPTWSAV